MTFNDKLLKAARSRDSWVCVGLDPEWERIDPALRAEGPRVALYEHCARLVEATKDVASSFKPNAAFFEAFGWQGMRALEELIAYIPGDVPVVLDAKRGDIGSTAKAYATAAFNRLGADAVTVAPYMGWDSVEPFAAFGEKCAFVLCRTSNPGARDFQDLSTGDGPLFEAVAKKVVQWGRPNLGVVAGATYPRDLARVRAIVGEEVPILIPGVGAQGASPADALKGANKDGEMALVVSSRGIARAPDPKAAAEQLRDELNRARKA